MAPNTICEMFTRLRLSAPGLADHVEREMPHIFRDIQIYTWNLNLALSAPTARAMGKWLQGMTPEKIHQQDRNLPDFGCDLPYGRWYGFSTVQQEIQSFLLNCGGFQTDSDSVSAYSRIRKKS